MTKLDRHDAVILAFPDLRFEEREPEMGWVFLVACFKDKHGSVNELTEPINADVSAEDAQDKLIEQIYLQIAPHPDYVQEAIIKTKKATKKKP